MVGRELAQKNAKKHVFFIVFSVGEACFSRNILGSMACRRLKVSPHFCMGLGEGECELRHKSTLGTTSAYLGNFLRFIRFHSVIIIRFYSVSFGFIRFYSFVLGVIPLSSVSCGFIRLYAA